MTFLSQLVAWVSANLPVFLTIAVPLVANLVTVFTSKPNVEGVLKYIQDILSWLSVLTHKDAATYTKLPFKPHA